MDVADGELAARARLLNQPFRKHARTGRPWVLFKSAMTLDGKVATQTGDSKWISGEASRAAGAPLARASATRSPSASAPRWPTTRSSPRASRASSASRARVVFDSEARLPLDSQLVREAAEVPLTSSSRARRRAPPPTRWRRRASRSSWRPARTSPRACARRSTSSARAEVTSILLEGGPHLAGAFLDAGEVDEVRLFLAPMLLGGRTARDPLEGEGVEAHRRGGARAHARLRAGRRGPADLGAAAGVVSVFTGLVAGARGGRGGRAATATACGCRVALAAGRASSREGDSVAVNGVCLTATRVDGDAFGADVMNETLRRTSLGEVDAGGAVNLELPLRAADRLGGHVVQGHVDGVGACAEARDDGFARVVTIARRPELLRYVVEKGSIAVDGVSPHRRRARRRLRSRSR